MKDDFAVVVGVEKYDASIGSLQGSERDARSFYEWLIDPKGGDVPKENITLIVSSKWPAGGMPTTDTVDEPFVGLRRKARDNGGRLGRRLYIFFAGHGIAPNGNPDEAAILMANAQPDVPYHIPGRLYANALLVEGMVDEIVLFMDCCRDNYSRAEVRSLPWMLSPNSSAGKTKHFYGFATRWGQKSRERQILDGRVVEQGGEFRGVFTTAVLEALQGRVRDASGAVTGELLVSHVHNRLPELLAGEFERPQFAHDAGIVFCAPPAPDNGAAVAAPAATTRVEIAFSPQVVGPVQIMAHRKPSIDIDHTAGRVELDLERGMYVLLDQGAARPHAFEVLVAERQHVDF